MLPNVANPKAITSSRFLLIMLTSIVDLQLPEDHLIQRLIDNFEFVALQEQHGGDSAAILQVRNYAHCAEASSFTRGLVDRLFQRSLRLSHRGALRLGDRHVVRLCDRRDLRDDTGRVVDQYFGELPVLRRIDRKLKRAAIDLEFAGDRLAFLFAGGKALLQADLRETQGPDQGTSTLIFA